MKVILFGASGQLGREWQYMVSRQFSGQIMLLPYTSSQVNITHHRKVTHELQEQQPDVVVNSAAYTKVDEAEDEKAIAKQVNADAVSHLAKMSDQLGFKFLHYSTDYIFPGKKEDRQKWPQGYPEDHPADPINWYGQTKWEGEQAVHKAGSDYLIIRLSWLCGQFGNNFVTKMLELAQQRDHLQVVADQWGSPTFTSNVVENSIKLLQTNQTGTFHITSQGLISWYDFACKIFNLSGVDVQPEPVSSDGFQTVAKRPYFSKLNTKKIETTPRTALLDWELGLQKLLYQLEGK